MKTAETIISKKEQYAENQDELESVLLNEPENEEQGDIPQYSAPIRMACLGAGACSPAPNGNNDYKNIRILQQSYGNRATLRFLNHNHPIQTKLKIGQPNDKYEQEADRLADQVVNMSDSDIQSKPARSMNTQSSSRDEKDILQAKESPGHIPRVTPHLESRINSLRGSGQPLPPSVRNYFEPRFGRNLKNIRIHNNSQSNEMTQTVNARAFTIGNDIVFGNGQYNPESKEGKKLIAHELTHASQQDSVSPFHGHNSLQPVSSSANHPHIQNHTLSPTIQRWEASEHLYIGEQIYNESVMKQIFALAFSKSMDDVARVPLEHHTEGVSLAHTVALGDFYRDPEELYKAPKADIEAIITTIDKEKKIMIDGKVGKSKDNLFSEAEKDKLTEMNELFTKASGLRYIAMAKENYTHFTFQEKKGIKNNIRQWEILHKDAISLTGLSRDEDNPELLKRAFLTNSYADHFLSDAFAAGHITARSPEESEMRDEILKMMSDVIEDLLNKKVDKYGIAIWFLPIDPIDKVLIQLALRLGVKAAAKYLSERDDIKSLKFKIVHDLDNEYGRLVANARGDEWTAFGDALFVTKENKDNLAMTLEAVRESRDDIVNIFNYLDPLYLPLDIYPSRVLSERSWGKKEARDRLEELIESNFSMLSILWEDDDMVRDYLKKVSIAEIASMKTLEKARMIKILLGGFTFNEDEQTILKILRGANQAGDIFEVVTFKGIGLYELLDNLHGDEYDELLIVLKKKFFLMLTLDSKKSWVKWASDWLTCEWHEELIVAILESCTKNEFESIVSYIGRGQLYWDLTGREEKIFKNLLKKHSMYYPVGSSSTIVRSPSYFPFCFTADTRVMIEDNSWKHISRITPGEMVISYGEKDKKLKARAVRQVFEYPPQDYLHIFLNNGISIKVTPMHKLYTNYSWREAGHLNKGDTLHFYDGNSSNLTVQNIIRIEKAKANGKVYDLSVEEDQNYFAEGILAHNKNM